MGKDEKITYKCPLCSYKSQKKNGVYGHYRFTHGGGKGTLKEEEMIIIKEGGEEAETPEEKAFQQEIIDVPGPILELNTNIGTDTSKGIKYSGHDLAIAENLITRGYAKNLQDLSRISLQDFALKKIGGDNMVKDEDPIEKLQKQRLMDVQIKSMEKDATSPAPTGNFQDMKQLMMQKVEMEMMQNMANPSPGKKEDSAGAMDRMMNYMMLQNMMRENKPSVDPAVAQMMQDLKSEIQNLRNEKDQNRLLEQVKEMIPKTNPESSIDRFYAMSMAKDKDSEMARREMMQKEKEFMAQISTKEKEMLNVALQSQIQSLNDKLAQIQQGGIGNNMKEQIETIKELNKLIGKGGEQTSKWDAAGKIMGDVAEKLNPAIQSYFENKAQARPYYPPQNYPMQSEPQPSPMPPMESFDQPFNVQQPASMIQPSKVNSDDDVSRDIVNMISQQDNFDDRKRQQ